MLVRDVMTPRVVSVAPESSLAAARQQLREHRIHHLIVVDHGSVVGLLSYRDMSGKKDEVTVREVMARDFATVDPETPVKRAAALMIGKTTGCLPVLDRGAIAGIITTTDLLRVVSGNGARAAVG